ncbi:E3 ubiquitin-protein ligase TRIM33-like isoform X2 [Mya arenaria]|uniref:E3 ubiquitin-protein ligase TRIM33-like isoform X2 n=1 Tax=Mya arenaria TaxID=6604 RepID=UPI0022E9517F|nr:E3 ubiquitin-protein ligase TRIM33-like isoform X2 [Mya arenaria]
MGSVPGRKAQIASGSAPEPTYCQPCAADGKKVFSKAFCPVCKEFLCSSCARVHRNMKLTKNHVLQDRSNMPSTFSADDEAEMFTETCQRHAIEFIKYYCPRHDSLLCGDCLLEDEEHRNCKVERIWHVAKGYKQVAEYNSLITGLVQTATNIGELSHDIQAIMKSVDEESLTNINELRKFRNEINQYLDKRENELLAEIEQKKRTSKTLLNELKSKCTNMNSSIEKIQSELQAQDDNSNTLLIVGKRAIKELAGLQAALGEVSRRSEVPRYKLHRDPETEQLIASEKAIGGLEIGELNSALVQQQRQQQRTQEQRQQETTQQHHKQIKAFSQKDESASALGHQERLQQKRQQPRQLGTIQQQHEHIQNESPKVKTSDDIRDCYLTSVALLTGDRLILADCDNYSLKLVDTDNNKLVSQVKLPAFPMDLCLLPGDRAAVTLPMEEKIQFVSTQGNFSLQDVVKVDGYCHGIDFCDNNLIVSFTNPGKVVLMDMKGKVKKSVDKDSSQKLLFHSPWNLTVTRDSRTSAIYISDWYTNSFTKLSISLEVLQSFQDPNLVSLHGLTAIGDNQLLVCGRDSDNILLLDTLTGNVTQLLGKEEGIEGPLSVAYCPRKKMMFVTCRPDKRPEFKNFVKVFNLV